MRKRLLSLFTVATLSACSPEPSFLTNPQDAPVEAISTDAKPDTKRIPKPELDAAIGDLALKTEDHVFNWATASDEMIWSALGHSTNVLSVGYKIPSFDPKNLTKINIKEKDWQAARQRILDIVFKEEKAFNKELQTPEDVVLYGENVMPNFDLLISQFSTIKKLRETGLIRFMEPADYQPKSDKGGKNSLSGRLASPFRFGCGDNEHAEPPLVNIVDYISTTPNSSKISWNLVSHGIQAAWARGATGRGFTMAYFDTGLSWMQNRMNGDFATGMSTGRTVQKLVTFPNARLEPAETPHDDCGHGTCIASIGTAPRVGLSSIGVAYQAGLVNIRASRDVFLVSAREWRGAANAYINMAQRPDVRVYSMSMGGMPIVRNGDVYSVYNSVLADGIMFAFNYGKAMFCAAGTTPEDWMPKNIVIFPATLSLVFAVTGVKIQYDNNNNPAPIGSYTNPAPCNECMYGPEVDFAVLIQKFNGNASRVLALPRLNETEPTSFGGSSAATATMAAMFTAVWSKYPNESIPRVLGHLINHSSNGFQNKHPRFGWGLVDLDAATVDATIPRRP